MTLSNPHFSSIRDLLREYAGVELDDAQREIVSARLDGILSTLEHDLTDFMRRIESRPLGEFHFSIAERLINHETSFLRNPNCFSALRQSVLPVLIETNATHQNLNIWSAACSTGQEPYSLAIMIREEFPQLEPWHVRLIASDVSKSVVEEARSGSFSQLEINRGLPARMLIKYFEQDGSTWHLRPSIRRAVEFTVLNLSKNWGTLPTMHLVLIRNVLMYFSPDTRREITERVAMTMKPGGFLMVGATERVLDISKRFAIYDEKASIYRLKD